MCFWEVILLGYKGGCNGNGTGMWHMVGGEHFFEVSLRGAKHFFMVIKGGAKHFLMVIEGGRRDFFSKKY